MQAFKNLHVLIAEDDADDAFLVLQSFKKHEAFTKINLARNGEELMSYLKDNSHSLPDMILTDINMPIKTGIEALSDIFHNNEFSKIPVFVYSSTINPVYEVKCRELGARGYLVKPFSLEKFDDIPYQMLYNLKHGKSL
jgi:CheY-like chemotaxis protein